MITNACYVHTNLIARNWQSLASFYESLFGSVHVPPERNYSRPALEAGTGIPNSSLYGLHLRLPCHGPNGPTLEIYSYSQFSDSLPPAVNKPGLTHLAFEVSSVEDARKQVLAAGGKPISEIVTLTTIQGENVT